VKPRDFVYNAVSVSAANSNTSFSFIQSGNTNAARLRLEVGYAPKR
jgi:hypothetical protein